MFLLAFKHDVDARLGPADGAAEGTGFFLPRLRVLGVRSDQQFGLAVFRQLSEELTRRSQISNCSIK